MGSLWPNHKALPEEIPIKLAAGTIIFTALGFLTTIFMSLNSGMRTYPIAISQHSFSVSNITKPMSQLQHIWDAELKFSQNSGLRAHIKHFQSVVNYPKFEALWCASVKPVESKGPPNGVHIRFDMTGCREEMPDFPKEEDWREISLEMKMDLLVPYQFGKTRIWTWLWGLSVEESCSKLEVEFVSSVGEGKMTGKGGWCFVPLPEF